MEDSRPENVTPGVTFCLKSNVEVEDAQYLNLQLANHEHQTYNKMCLIELWLFDRSAATRGKNGTLLGHVESCRSTPSVPTLPPFR